MAHESKWTRDIFHQISDAARCVHDFAVLGRVTHTTGKWVRMCIQVEGHHNKH
jgi:hypothetical protein